MIRRIPDILRGLFRNSPEGFWAHSGKLQKISANIRGFLGRGPSFRRVPVSEHQAVGSLWDWHFNLWELDDRVGENPTFSVKSGLKLDFAGTLMIPERFWTYCGSSRNKLDPFRNPPEGNWGQSCKLRRGNGGS
jgi:hypothetical protein